MVNENTHYQIFSYKQYIFKVSPTLEKLYRFKYRKYRYKGLEINEVTETAVFKRVRSGEPEMKHLLTINQERISGRPEPFYGKMYEVWALRFDRKLCGYVLYARECHGSDQVSSAERMYFAFESIK